jgi:glycosyltransferase involved in cell wall biosynthesis
MTTASISVITSTLNCETDLAHLINSLECQTDSSFTWIVQDGMSTDGTQALVKKSTLQKVALESGRDFGIYDAINRALARCDTDYYLVIGADDKLDKDAIANFRKLAMDRAPDFVAMGVAIGDRKFFPQANKGWRYGMYGVSGCHSVGLLIKSNLHQRFGFYSNKFAIVADQYFVKSALNRGASIVRADIIAGEYSDAGFSASNSTFFMFEFALMQLLTEKNKLLQLAIFMARLLKNFRKF